ncbi:hypothetical protein ACN47E_006190 [Coniothyrium glycines]
MPVGAVGLRPACTMALLPSVEEDGHIFVTCSPCRVMPWGSSALQSFRDSRCLTNKGFRVKGSGIAQPCVGMTHLNKSNIMP